MKTKPKSEERTVTYYPEAVELKGTLKYDEVGNQGLCARELSRGEGQCSVDCLCGEYVVRVLSSTHDYRLRPPTPSLDTRYTANTTLAVVQHAAPCLLLPARLTRLAPSAQNTLLCSQHSFSLLSLSLTPPSGRHSPRSIRAARRPRGRPPFACALPAPYSRSG